MLIRGPRESVSEASGFVGCSYIGDPDSGVGLVAAVDADQVGRQRLDRGTVAQATAVHAPDAGDEVGERLDQVGCLAVVAEDEYVGLDRLDLGVVEEHRADVVERTDDSALRENGGRL